MSKGQEKIYRPSRLDTLMAPIIVLTIICFPFPRWKAGSLVALGMLVFVLYCFGLSARISDTGVSLVRLWRFRRCIPWESIKAIRSKRRHLFGRRAAFVEGEFALSLPRITEFYGSLLNDIIERAPQGTFVDERITKYLKKYKILTEKWAKARRPLFSLAYAVLIALLIYRIHFLLALGGLEYLLPLTFLASSAVALVHSAKVRMTGRAYFYWAVGLAGLIVLRISMPLMLFAVEGPLIFLSVSYLTILVLAFLFSLLEKITFSRVLLLVVCSTFVVGLFMLFYSRVSPCQREFLFASRVIPEDENWWSPNGEKVIVAGNLFVPEIESNTKLLLEVYGIARGDLNTMEFHGSSGNISVTPDGSKVAVIERFYKAGSRFWLIDLVTMEKQLICESEHFLLPFGSVLDPGWRTWSPDASRFIFGESDEGKRALWILDLSADLKPRKILEKPGWRSAFWVSNEEIYLFGSFRYEPEGGVTCESPLKISVKSVRPDGSDLKEVFQSTKTYRKVAVFAREKYALMGDDEGRLWTLNLRNFEEARFNVEAPERFLLSPLAWSKDRRFLTYVINKAGISSIIKVDMEQRTSEIIYSSNMGEVGSLAWSPSNKWLLFSLLYTPNSMVDYLRHCSVGGSIFMIDARGEYLRKVTSEGFGGVLSAMGGTSFSWSPVKDAFLYRIVYLRRNATAYSKIYLARLKSKEFDSR